MSQRRRLIKSFMSVAALKLLSIPLTLATSILLARVLGVSAFGQYAFIMSLVPILALPIAAGVPQLLTREVAGYVQQRQWGMYRGMVHAAYIWILCVSSLLYVLYLLFTHLSLTPQAGKWTLLPFALLLVSLTGLNAVRNGVMRGLKAPFLASLPEMLVQPALLLIFIAGLLWFSSVNLDQVILVQVTATFLSFAIATSLLLRIQPESVKTAKATYQGKMWARALLPFTLLYVVTTLNTNIGTVLVGFLSDDKNVAAMRIAERMGQFIALPLQVANTIISPYIVEAWKSGDVNRLQRLYKQSARSTLVLSIPPALTLIFLGKPLISLVYGAEYGEIAAMPVAFIAIGQLINVFFGSVGILLSMSGYENYTLRGQALALFFSIGLSAFLIPHFGATGAAIGIAVGLLAWNTLISMYVRRHIGIRPTAL